MAKKHKVTGPDGDGLTLNQRKLKANFIRKRGYWSPFWQALLELDSDYFEVYIDFRDIPWKKGCLEPKMKELIYIAMDASATHMFDYGLRSHIQSALRVGATKEEIWEVVEIVSVIGIHSAILAAPILLEELERQDKPLSELRDSRSK